MNKTIYSITKNPLNGFSWIVTGVSQSDGSFGISFKKSKSKIGIYPSSFFRIELTQSSYPLLEKIYLHFCCGRIGERTERDMCYFEVTDFYSIWHIIIPLPLGAPWGPLGGPLGAPWGPLGGPLGAYKFSFLWC